MDGLIGDPVAVREREEMRESGSEGERTRESFVSSGEGVAAADQVT